MLNNLVGPFLTIRIGRRRAIVLNNLLHGTVLILKEINTVDSWHFVSNESNPVWLYENVIIFRRVHAKRS